VNNKKTKNKKMDDNNNSLNPAFVYIGNEILSDRVDFIHRDLMSAIDREVIKTFHENVMDAEDVGYIKGLQFVYDILEKTNEWCNKKMISNFQKDSLKEQIRQHFCAFEEIKEDEKPDPIDNGQSLLMEDYCLYINRKLDCFHTQCAGCREGKKFPEGKCEHMKPMCTGASAATGA